MMETLLRYTKVQAQPQEKQKYSPKTTELYIGRILSGFIYAGAMAIVHSAYIFLVDLPADVQRQMLKVCPPLSTLGIPGQTVDSTIKVMSPERNVEYFNLTQALIGRRALCEAYEHSYYWKRQDGPNASNAAAEATLGVLGLAIGLAGIIGDKAARRKQLASRATESA